MTITDNELILFLYLYGFVTILGVAGLIAEVSQRVTAFVNKPASSYHLTKYSHLVNK